MQTFEVWGFRSSQDSSSGLLGEENGGS